MAHGTGVTVDDRSDAERVDAGPGTRVTHQAMTIVWV